MEIRLSPRELEVLRGISDASTNAEIAEALVISAGTVARHVSNMLAKTGLKNRTDLARYAVEHGLTTPPISDVKGDLPQQQDLYVRGPRRLKNPDRAGTAWEVGGADSPPGNLPAQATSFVGRDLKVAELAELLRAHRLVTLTGVGGVGKTRLAIEVATDLAAEFPDGVWLVELAPVSNPNAVPDAVAAVLGVTPQADLSVADSIAEALRGRRLLLLLDNCEHVVDAAADLVDTVLARASTLKVLATSREGLRANAEHLLAVPPLDVSAGVSSEAVELFVERAQAAIAGFSLDNDADMASVTEICRHLDGIALAIELAAARMVSMSPADVNEHLGDRFRFLSGSDRGSQRHRTLRDAVAWSYDLLGDEERSVLTCCAVFADGFDLAAATQICGEGLDEYAVLDLLDSLVRKSLVTMDQASGHTRYGLLETIRQFSDDQLAMTATTTEVRGRHARYFADQAMDNFAIWEGPSQRVAVDWVDGEFANLRAAFRWAADEGDITSAATIAAHTSMLNRGLQRYESVGWAEEILDTAGTAALPQLARVYTAASLCLYTGRPETAIGYARTAVELEAEPDGEPFDVGWSGFWEGMGYLYTGQVDPCVEVLSTLADQTGLAHVAGLCGMLYVLPAVGRAREARAVAEEAVTAARAHGNPLWIALALGGEGRAFSDSDPNRALAAFRRSLAFAAEHRLPFMEALIARDAAALEALHGDVEQALALFDTTLQLFHRAGDQQNLGSVLAHLAVFFDRIEQPEIAATLYGTTTQHGGIDLAINLAGVVDHLGAAFGHPAFDDCVARGSALDTPDAVQYARAQIEAAGTDFSIEAD